MPNADKAIKSGIDYIEQRMYTMTERHPSLIGFTDEFGNNPVDTWMDGVYQTVKNSYCPDHTVRSLLDIRYFAIQLSEQFPRNPNSKLSRLFLKEFLSAITNGLGQISIDMERCN